LSTTPNDSPVISDQMISNQMKLPPIWQFSPLEDTSDTHRAHGSTRSRHKRASSRAPKPNMSRDRKGMSASVTTRFFTLQSTNPARAYSSSRQEFHLHAKLPVISAQFHGWPKTTAISSDYR
jgi:hypothetical protein